MQRSAGIRGRGRLSARQRLSVVLVCVAAVGCSSQEEEELPPTAQTSGVVLVDGKPLADAQVMFHPQGQGNPATGRTEENGRFVLTTYEDRDGAVPGTHVVTIQVFPAGALPGMEFGEDGGESPVPMEYSDVSTSTLSATVESGKPNDIKLEISSE